MRTRTAWIVQNMLVAIRNRAAAAFNASSAIITALFLLGMIPGKADAATFGDVICNISTPNSVGDIGAILTGVAYLGGAIAIGSGLLMLSKSAENSRDNPLHKAIAAMVGGTGLLFLPGFTNWSVTSLFTYQGAGGVTSCVPGQPQSSSGGGLDVMMTNLVQNIQDPMVYLISFVSFIAGTFFMIRGLQKATKYGADPRANSVTAILANIIFGALLFTVGQTVDTIMTTIFGTNSITSFDAVGNAIDNMFASAGDTTQFKAAMKAAFTFFQLIGMIAFVRGILVLKAHAEGDSQKTITQGLTHIIGGAMAINIYEFLQQVNDTFGFDFLS